MNIFDQIASGINDSQHGYRAESYDADSVFGWDSDNGRVLYVYPVDHADIRAVVTSQLNERSAYVVGVYRPWGPVTDERLVDCSGEGPAWLQVTQAVIKELEYYAANPE